MMLPKPPSLQEIQAHIPRIGPVPEGTHRPFWSVMITTYNNGHYTRRTLESVLAQDPGPDEMQIEVVDGCSTKYDPEPITREVGKGRVSFFRLPCNKGPAHTYNACIERARGRWVHILHGDDMVLPGFYEVYASFIRKHPEVRAVLGQVVVIDEQDRWIDVWGTQPPAGGGIWQDFLEQELNQQLVQFPCVAVRRDAYEEIGGYCTLFDHVVDWDMWFRLGQLAPVACVPRPWALYRVHGESDSNRHLVSGANMMQSYFVVKANLERLKGSAVAVKQSWRSHLARRAESTAWRLGNRNCSEGRYNQTRWAWMLEPTTRRSIKLLKSWLQWKLLGRTAKT
jgi:GT2 family glycosyltransferase